MKRFIPLFTALIVVLASVALVSFKASAATVRHAYTFDELITSYRKNLDTGEISITLGDTDPRFSPVPFVVRYAFRAGSTTPYWTNETNGYITPAESTNSYSPSVTWKMNFYPFGSTGSNNTYAVAVGDYLSPGVQGWQVTYALGFLDETLSGVMAWVPFSVLLEVTFFDSSFNVINTQAYEPHEYFTFSSIVDEFAPPTTTLSFPVTVPATASYFTYRYRIEPNDDYGAMPDSQFAGQIFFSAELTIPTVNYSPPAHATEDLLDDLVNGYVPPVIPDGAGDLDDVHDMEMGILGDLLDTVVQITQQILASLEIIQRYGIVLGFIGWMFSLLYQIHWVQELIQISFMLGIVTVLLNVSLTVTSGIRSRRKSRTNNSKSKSSKGD